MAKDVTLYTEYICALRPQEIMTFFISASPVVLGSHGSPLGPNPRVGIRNDGTGFVCVRSPLHFPRLEFETTQDAIDWLLAQPIED